jgi:plasmid stability protein
MEEEVRDILRNAVKVEDSSSGGLGTGISSLFAKVGLETDIPELRGHKIEPANFGR